ncbi:MAG TPA: efflux RND transporter periplasmic adaptor subunit [Anaerolineae bacterium]|nr:efflux RND transporter periplasmic adaptor subunit [Anaerolineae bacterium]
MNNRDRFIRLCLLASLLLPACATQTAAGTGQQSPPAAAPTRRPLNRRGTLQANGQLVPNLSANLSFGMGGEVAEVLGAEGNPVKAGDVIARLRGDALQAAVAQAEAGVAEAKARLALLPQQIANAEAELRAAQARLAGSRASGANQAELLAAEAALADAQFRQVRAQAEYDSIVQQGQLGPTEEEARRVLEQATRDVQIAQARLSELGPGSADGRASSAQAAAANAAIFAAQTRLDQLKAEASGEAVGAPTAAVQKAEAALLAARAALAKTELRAPFDGTIAQVNLQAGQQVSANTKAVVLADFSSWQIVTDDLNEFDIPAVTVGQPALVTLNALPDLNLTGEVQSIGLFFQDTGTRATYPISIKLANSDPRLRWGMTAIVTFEQPAD